jgi:Rap1a immunity proteins
MRGATDKPTPTNVSTEEEVTMTKAGLLFGGALALTVTAAPAVENRGSANHMLPSCRAFVDYPKHDVPDLDMGFCAGVVQGVAETGRGVGFTMRLEPLSDVPNMRERYCLEIPQEVVLSQLVRVVVAYIEARPARMHEQFHLLATEALRTAWPCRHSSVSPPAGEEDLIKDWMPKTTPEPTRLPKPAPPAARR